MSQKGAVETANHCSHNQFGTLYQTPRSHSTNLLFVNEDETACAKRLSVLYGIDQAEDRARRSAILFLLLNTPNVIGARPNLPKGLDQ
jgi:hypothetical protein